MCKLYENNRKEQSEPNTQALLGKVRAYMLITWTNNLEILRYFEIFITHILQNENQYSREQSMCLITYIYIKF
jgi:hypothetical protein